MSLSNPDDVLRKEVARLVCSEYELETTIAFTAGPEIKQIRDAEFLAMILDPTYDIFKEYVERNADRTLKRIVDGKKIFAGAALSRARRLLKGYCPTTRTDQQLLLAALRRYGLEEEADKLKREHDL